MQDEQPDQVEPPTPRPKGPMERHSVIPGDVAMSLSRNGNLVYEVTDRYCGGNTTRYLTIQRMIEWQPALSKKTATAGIKECLALGFLKDYRRSSTGTSAFRVTVIYNPARGKDTLAMPGPVTPRAAPKRPKRPATSDAPVIEGGRVLHEPRPVCAGTTGTGSACRSRAKVDSDLCRVHDDKRLSQNATPGDEKSPGAQVAPGTTPGDFSDLAISPFRTQSAETPGDKKSPGAPLYSSRLRGRNEVPTDKPPDGLSTGTGTQYVETGTDLESESVSFLSDADLSPVTDPDRFQRAKNATKDIDTYVCDVCHLSFRDCARNGCNGIASAVA